jgi:hypothetical protein
MQRNTVHRTRKEHFTMARPNRSINRDWPQLESQPFASLAAGSATDPAAGSEIQMAALPDLSAAFPPSSVAGAGQAGSLPDNRMWVRWAAFCSQGTSATVGGATNNADLELLVYRFQTQGLPSSSNPAAYIQGIIAHYPLNVNTTLSGGVTAGSVQTVGVASGAAILPGMSVAVDTGAAYEIVKILAVSGNNITAYFQFAHSSSAAVTSVLQPNTPIPFLLNGAGVVPAGVTAGGSITAGSNKVVTPAGMPSITMLGIHVGDTLLIDTVGSGVQEQVVVTAVTAKTFTANFANAHNSSAPIVTATDAQGAPKLANGPRFTLQPGDVLKLTRTSNNVTGIATPAGNCFIDWVPSSIGQ